MPAPAEDEREVEVSEVQATAKEGRSCKIEGCKRPYRAKGYCNVHYRKWRRGELPKPRYKTCNQGSKKRKKGEKKECLKPVFKRGLCEEHYNAKYGKKQQENAG